VASRRVRLLADDAPFACAAPRYASSAGPTPGTTVKSMSAALKSSGFPAGKRHPALGTSHLVPYRQVRDDTATHEVRAPWASS
jgi:hypothetical protein